jgi:hypothetical protein
MQKTLKKIDQLIDLHTTMGSDFTAKKLKEIRDEVVGMYSEEEVIKKIERSRDWFEQFKKKSND